MQENENLKNEGAPYEAPAIESVITPEEMEREVHYAGNVSPSTPIPT